MNDVYWAITLYSQLLYIVHILAQLGQTLYSQLLYIVNYFIVYIYQGMNDVYWAITLYSQLLYVLHTLGHCLV